MIWSIQRKLTTGLVLVFVMAGLAAVGVVWRNSLQLKEANAMVAHTQEVLAGLEGVLGLMKDAETGVRGFLISGQEAYLEPFRAAQSQIGGCLEHIRQLTADNPAQQASLREVQRLLVEQFQRHDSILRTARDLGLHAARQPGAIGETKAGMDALRQTIGEMEAWERRLLQQRQQASEASDLAARRTLETLAVLIAAMLLGGYVLIRYHLLRRRRAEEELERVFALALDMLCIAGTDGYFRRINPAFSQTLGWSQEELLTQPFLHFVHPDDRAATVREVEHLAGGQPVISFENRYRCKDGSWRWLSWKSVPQPGGVIFAMARDVSERKQAEETIRRLNADLIRQATQLIEANKELESFSYSVSHDLRAPLRHIQGYVEMLSKNMGDQISDKDRRYLTIIANASVEMGQLIDDLLAFSRMGRSEMHQITINLDNLVAETVRRLETLARARNIVWTIAPLPPVVGDPAMLRVALANLLDNAVKYTRPRDPARIEIGCAGQEGQQAILFVKDNGVGFDMQYSDKLFEVFQRLHRADEFEGTGIGLANVRRIIARHGGRVWAEGEPDRGATFYFTVKLSPVEALTESA